MNKYLIFEDVWAFNLKEAVAIGATVFVARTTYAFLVGVGEAIVEKVNTVLDNSIEKAKENS